MIKGFVSIPEFIKKYIDRNEPGLENMTHDFCKLLTEIGEPVHIETKDSKTYCEYNITNLYSVHKFCEFYLEKSKLRDKLECIYEDELDIPKSISNEIFTIELEDEKFITAVIDNIDNDIMTLVIL